MCNLVVDGAKQTRIASRIARAMCKMSTCQLISAYAG